jgi:hypothetical protein
MTNVVIAKYVFADKTDKITLNALNGIPSLNICPVEIARTRRIHVPSVGSFSLGKVEPRKVSIPVRDLGDRLLKACKSPHISLVVQFKSFISYVQRVCNLGWERNFVPKKFRGIASERFPLFRGRKHSFRGIPSSAEEPIPKLGTKWNSAEILVLRNSKIT